MTKALLEKIKEMEERVGQGWMKELEDINTAGELKNKASEFGIELSEALSVEAFNLLNSDESEELNEEELSVVAGGKFYI